MNADDIDVSHEFLQHLAKTLLKVEKFLIKLNPTLHLACGGLVYYNQNLNQFKFTGYSAFEVQVWTHLIQVFGRFQNFSCFLNFFGFFGFFFGFFSIFLFFFCWFFRNFRIFWSVFSEAWENRRIFGRFSEFLVFSGRFQIFLVFFWIFRILSAFFCCNFSEFFWFFFYFLQFFGQIDFRLFPGTAHGENFGGDAIISFFYF